MSDSPAFPNLTALAGTRVTSAYCRIVERAALERPTKPDFLFTSGNPGRYNPRGIYALYAAEDQSTAGAEAERYRGGRTTQSVVYWAKPSAVVLDLSSAANLAALGLTGADLFANWRFAPTPTPCQLLGQAIAAQTRLAGIRFPSDAAKARGFTGYNVVFFKAAVVSPSSLIVSDDVGTEVQRWP